MPPMMDYNEEARKLWARLDDTKQSRFNNLDPMYRSEAGGFIYVGGDLVRLKKRQRNYMFLAIQKQVFNMVWKCLL